MVTFTDDYGDRLDVHKNGDGIELVTSADVHAVEFAHRQTAHDIAQAILEAIGEGDSRPVSAKELSYNEGAMRLAAIHGKMVEFRYVKSADKAPETRRLKPSSVRGSGEHLRFTGYDPDRDETRAFRLDRIRGDVRVVV